MKKEMKKVRAPNLTEENISDILRLIDGWCEPKLTWDGIISAIEVRLHARYTRQALAKHQRIQVAYDTQNKILAHNPIHPRSTGIPALDEALAVIARQRAEIARLKKGEQNFLEQFAKWASNAAMEGIDPRKLDRPIESVNRDASEPQLRKARKGK